MQMVVERVVLWGGAGGFCAQKKGTATNFILHRTGFSSPSTAHQGHGSPCLAMSFIWGSGMGKSPQSTPFSWGWEWAINFQIEDRADPNTCRKWTFPIPNRCLLYNVERMNGRGSFCDAVSRNTQAEFTEDYQDLPRNQQFLGMPAVPPKLRMFVSVKHMSNKLQKSN